MQGYREGKRRTFRNEFTVEEFLQAGGINLDFRGRRKVLRSEGRDGETTRVEG